MGTSSKGNQVWVSPWRTKQHCPNGAFGQSYYQKVQTHNEGVARVKAIQAILATDKSITKEDRQKYEKQLRELTQ